MPGEPWGEPQARADGLSVWLRTPVPESLETGGGSAIFLHGAAYAPGRRIRRVELAAGGRPAAAGASSMPSPSLAAELGDPAGARSIFWGVVPLGGDGDPSLTATFDDGGSATAVLGAAERGAHARPGGRAAGTTVAICMATYEPPAGLLERQLDSLRDQTHTDWVCVISDDASSEEAFARIERLTAGDRRFTVSRAAERAGAYANFARALAMVPPETAYVALCDQDDRWYAEKLDALLAGLGDARLVFSDMRLTDPAGAVVAPTYWTRRRPNHDNFGSLLLGNSVTGAASLFPRELLDEALPLPPRAGNLYHDHWLALVAAAGGRIAYVDRPLYDYVQHSSAAIGHAGANRGVVGGGVVQRLRALRGRERGRLREEWRRIYFAEYCRAALMAVALEQRLGPAIGARQRRAMRLLLAADGSPRGAAWLSLRQLRRPFHDDTGGSESGMLRGLAWRRAMSARRGRDPLDDADLPPGIVGVDPTPATLPARDEGAQRDGAG
jgi:glycosyltransferase involved in cell wall biosynthesis